MAEGGFDGDAVGIGDGEELGQPADEGDIALDRTLFMAHLIQQFDAAFPTGYLVLLPVEPPAVVCALLAQLLQLSVKPPLFLF